MTTRGISTAKAVLKPFVASPVLMFTIGFSDVLLNPVSANAGDILPVTGASKSETNVRLVDVAWHQVCRRNTSPLREYDDEERNSAHQDMLMLIIMSIRYCQATGCSAPADMQLLAY
ncbi:hypothetical protein ACJQWK_09113 [Exserohilum turcicum]